MSPLTFKGRNRVHVKREVLSYWHKNRSQHGMTLKEFLSRCRFAGSEREVVYLPTLKVHQPR
ncbi:MAG TPA: hypothetical protein EYN06_07720 [Myxococcales bacterium]|nr:hypothetical protein [Myxococcales bacterium]HIN86353.1 hypothetical protein [Myxococcales bacterium]